MWLLILEKKDKKVSRVYGYVLSTFRFFVKRRTKVKVSTKPGKIVSQSAFTYSKLTTETLEQAVKYVQS